MSSFLRALQEVYEQDALWFPIHSGYTYLVGYTTRERRAICLKDDGGPCRVYKEDVLLAYREVQDAGLVTPFLFFGMSKRYSDEAFIFRQFTCSENIVVFPKMLYRH